MSEIGEYKLPSYLQKPSSTSGLLKNWLRDLGKSEYQKSQEHKERESVFLDTIRRQLTEDDATELAFRAASGEVRLRDIIPQELTPEAMKAFWTYSDQIKIALLYTLVCSSLYYKILAQEIRPANVKEIVEKIHSLFKDSDIFQREDYFSETFSVAVRKNPNLGQVSIPMELKEILDNPLLIKEQFIHLLSNVQG